MFKTKMVIAGSLLAGTVFISGCARNSGGQSDSAAQPAAAPAAVTSDSDTSTAQPAVANGQPTAYVDVEPGYYYDEAFVDVHGLHHDRNYYYYNGHSFEHRDRVPQGYTAHVRVQKPAPHPEAHPASPPHGQGNEPPHSGH
ncbi:MAG TPA: hypothetical protein VGG19_00200 [Tepidisphaeraceae bacterium]